VKILGIDWFGNWHGSKEFNSGLFSRAFYST